MKRSPVHYNISLNFIRQFSLFRWTLPLAQNYFSPNNYSFPAFIYNSSAFCCSSPLVRSVTTWTKMCCENAKTSSEMAKMCCDVAKTFSETAKMLSERAKTCSEVTNVYSEIATMNKDVTKMSSEPPTMCCEMAKTFSEEAKMPFDPRKPDFLLKISNKVTIKHNLLLINDNKFQSPNVYKTWGEFLITTK